MLDWEVSPMTAFSTRKVASSSQLALALIGAVLSLQVFAGSALAARTEPTSRAPPLDLKIGDVRCYVDAATLATPVPSEMEEIIVPSQRPALLPEQRVIPQGLGALAYGVAHPLQAWRILLPDPNFRIAQRTEDDLQPPPGEYRAKMPDAGATFG